MCNQSKCECKAEPGLLEKKSEPHVHAASMKLYAEDAAETDKPWERWEVLAVGHQFWNTCVEGLYWHPSNSYRRKRKTRVVNGFSVPAPETKAPASNSLYYAALTNREYWISTGGYLWVGDKIDLRFLSRGLVFLNKDDAVANAKAMCGIDPST